MGNTRAVIEGYPIYRGSVCLGRITELQTYCARLRYTNRIRVMGRPPTRQIESDSGGPYNPIMPVLECSSGTSHAHPPLPPFPSPPFSTQQKKCVRHRLDKAVCEINK